MKQPILNKLESLNQEEAISLHVPGHKKYDYRSFISIINDNG
ncbi:Arginine decarboxylase / Lysine decarboxylase [Staphylococcus aureus]|nr:Arginine decarboxylase / Lysine decarboxylase [Staphylococcus aureus]